MAHSYLELENESPTSRLTWPSGGRLEEQVTPYELVRHVCIGFP
jgi:hypothetical protein